MRHAGFQVLVSPRIVLQGPDRRKIIPADKSSSGPRMSFRARRVTLAANISSVDKIKPGRRPVSTMAQDPIRDRREQERQRLFRERFVANTPKWYRGEYHLIFMLLVTLGTMAYCGAHIENAKTWEWLLILPIALFGNWVEWAAHRYVLHRPVPGLKMFYKRQCTAHHQFFTQHDLCYHGQAEWRALLFPPFAPIGFILVSIPPALLLGALVSRNVGYIVVLTMAGYYLLYEGLHTLSHLEDERHPYLKHIPLIN